MKKGKRKSRARSLLKGAGSAVKGGLIGGGSALASDVVLGLGVVPAPLKTGVGNVLARTALAFGAGMAVQKLTKSHESGRDATVGAMSVMFRDVGRSAIKTRFPSVPMGELADLTDALGDTISEDEIAGLAELIDGDMDGVGALEMGEAFDTVDGLGGEFEFVDGLGGELAVMG